MSTFHGIQCQLPKPITALPHIRAVLLDFDGTLSLLREGWANVMIPMMLEQLRDCPAFVDSSDSEKHLTEAVLKLNGQATIKQMEFLAAEVKKHGGHPASPSEYKEEYLQRLTQVSDQRKMQIVAGEKSVEDFLVPGSRRMLDVLAETGWPLILASGTDHTALLEEAELLKVGHYFQGEIYGPKSETDGFTKAKVTDAFLQKRGIEGTNLLCIGDGFVETKVTKDREGFAIGVAYEHDSSGEYCEWRRVQLVEAGADVLVPDLSQFDVILSQIRT